MFHENCLQVALWECLELPFINQFLEKHPKNGRLELHFPSADFSAKNVEKSRLSRPKNGRV